MPDISAGRAAISVERVEFNPEDNTVTVFEKQNRAPSGKQATYSVLEFMALLAGHITSPYETVTFYYGVRGKENKEKAGEQKIETEELKGTAKASSTWVRLIHKIFENNPLRCPKCGKEMRIIAFITDYHEVKKILKHIGEETQGAPSLLPATVSNLEFDFGDYIPPDDVYFHDEEYVC